MTQQVIEAIESNGKKLLLSQTKLEKTCEDEY